MTDPVPVPVPLGDDALIAWKAARLRIAQEQPWLTAALFRAVPADSTGVNKGVDADRYGRLYLDFADEKRVGMEVFAGRVVNGLATWLQDTVQPAQWHAGMDDPRFDVVAPADLEQIRTATAARLSRTPATRNHDSAAQRRENKWREWASTIVGETVTPWQQVLASHLRKAVAWKAGAVDYTYSRPSRRRVPGVVFPAMRHPRVSVAVVADISPSITELLPVVAAEIRGIGTAIGIDNRDVTVIACDDEVRDVFPLTSGTINFPEPEGGTDMTVGISGALTQQPRPAVVVVITDGRTPWPDKAPAVPVIVALVCGKYVLDAVKERVPGWASVVVVDADRLEDALEAEKVKA